MFCILHSARSLCRLLQIDDFSTLCKFYVFVNYYYTLRITDHALVIQKLPSISLPSTSFLLKRICLKLSSLECSESSSLKWNEMKLYSILLPFWKIGKQLFIFMILFGSSFRTKPDLTYESQSPIPMGIGKRRTHVLNLIRS